MPSRLYRAVRHFLRYRGSTRKHKDYGQVTRDKNRQNPYEENIILIYMTDMETPDTRPTRRKVSCRLCKKEGHNIRGCKVFVNVQKKAYEQYESWLHHCIVGISNEWTEFTTYRNALIPPSDHFKTVLDNYRHLPNALEKILDEPIEWLTSRSDIEINGLMYGYRIDPNAPRAQVLSILHYNFLSEADAKWMRNYDVERALPYVLQSIEYIDVLEEANAQIFNYPILLNEMQMVAGLHSKESREDRVRILYLSTQRLLRQNRNELTRGGRQFQEIERTYYRVQRQYNNVRDTHNHILELRERYLEDLNLFPSDCLKAKIQLKFDRTTDAESTHDCPICLDPVQNLVSLGCGHQFCVKCILKTVFEKYNAYHHLMDCTCPLCRCPIKQISGDVSTISNYISQFKLDYHIQEDIRDLIG